MDINEVNKIMDATFERLSTLTGMDNIACSEAPYVKPSPESNGNNFVVAMCAAVSGTKEELMNTTPDTLDDHVSVKALISGEASPVAIVTTFCALFDRLADFGVSAHLFTAPEDLLIMFTKHVMAGRRVAAQGGEDHA